MKRTISLRQRGFSLIEFMIAITISLVVLAALSGLFVSVMGSRAELDRANALIENGRYALKLLFKDLQLAGYFGEFDVFLAEPTLDMPADKPDPCLTTLADLDTAIPVPIQGYDGGATLSCVSDVRAGTDILVIRRVSTCLAGAAGCATIAGAPYFQPSLCSNGAELLNLDSDNWFRMHTNVANLDRTQRDCATTANFRRFRTHIYFVANNDASGDGIPTLKRAELGAGVFTTTSLVNGVENLQFEYGIDSDGDGDPDAYSSNPDIFNACTDAVCRLANWRNVTTAKVNLLIRSNTESTAHEDTKTYSLGLDANGDEVTVGPFNDGYRRHAFQSLVRLNNLVMRRR